MTNLIFDCKEILLEGRWFESGPITNIVFNVFRDSINSLFEITSEINL